MTPERLIYADAPAFIPIPKALQHRKVEIIIWPLEAEEQIETKPDTNDKWTEIFKRHSKTVDEIKPFSRDEIYAERLR